MRIALVIGMLALVGCKKDDAGDDVLAKMTPLVERYCACKDAACMEAVAAEIRGLPRVAEDHPDSAKVAALASQALACNKALTRAGAPARAVLADAAREVAALRDAMCACADRDCATKVTSDLTRFKAKLAAVTVEERDPGALHGHYIELARCAVLAAAGGPPVVESPK